MALPNKTKIPIGTVLAGKYRITREIGRGGMAAVYEAENVDIGKRVAIKVLAQELTTSAIVVERFLREARAAAAIRSPYICDVYDSGRLEDGRPFLVLELLEGESLYERMTKIRYLDGENTVTVMVQTCRGLTKAHAANIVHRDLKPENIFLTKDEESRLLAKILDFGLAKFYAPMASGSDQPQQARLTREGAVFGTPAYMSPEQVRGQGAVDHRADLWALGCITYECLTGKTVWSTEQGVAMTFAQIANAPIPRPNVLRPDLPAEFTVWFDKALNRDITKRFQTAREFGDELAQAFNQSARASLAAGDANSAVLPIDMLHSDPAEKTSPLGTRRIAVDAVTAAPPAPKPSSGAAVSSGNTSAASVSVPGSVAIPSAPQTQPSADQSVGGPTSTRSSKLGFVAPSHDKDHQASLPSAPPRKSSALGRAVVGLVAVGLIGGGAYAGYVQFVDVPKPTPQTPSSAETAASAAPKPSASASAAHDAGAAPAELPWESTVHQGQQAIANNDLKGALKLFKDAFDKGGHGVPRTMMDHVQVALGGLAEKPACHLTGLGRPRAYDLTGNSSRVVAAGHPTILLGPRGPIVAWTDAHEGGEHAYAVSLDDAMRNAVQPVDITPEAGAVQRVELTRDGDHVVVVYWDSKGNDVGMHARLLDADGRIAGASVAIAPAKGPASPPSIARAGDGSLFVIWSDEIDRDSEDLFMRRLSPKLEPQGEVVRVTDLTQTSAVKPRARWPSIAVESNALQIAFRLERDPTHNIEVIRLPITDASKGVDPPKKGVPAKGDRNIGEMALVNSDKAKSDYPIVSCGNGACFVVWHGEQGGGAQAAYIDPTKAQPLWRKKFAKAGTHPSVSVSPSGPAQLVWFEGGKVETASITKDGIGPASKLSRVSGEMPPPSISPGA
jgi:serine/threonine protein kinase